MKQSSGPERKETGQSTFGERLLFVIWLGGRVLGVENNKQFAEAIDKGAAQLSKWVREEPRPSWENIKTIAGAVGVEAAWLDDPARAAGSEPPDFAEWLAARREREKRLRRKAR